MRSTSSPSPAPILRYTPGQRVQPPGAWRGGTGDRRRGGPTQGRRRSGPGHPALPGGGERLERRLASLRRPTSRWPRRWITGHPAGSVPAHRCRPWPTGARFTWPPSRGRCSSSPGRTGTRPRIFWSARSASTARPGRRSVRHSADMGRGHGRPAARPCRRWGAAQALSGARADLVHPGAHAGSRAGRRHHHPGGRVRVGPQIRSGRPGLRRRAGEPSRAGGG